MEAVSTLHVGDPGLWTQGFQSSTGAATLHCEPRLTLAGLGSHGRANASMLHYAGLLPRLCILSCIHAARGQGLDPSAEHLPSRALGPGS